MQLGFVEPGLELLRDDEHLVVPGVVRIHALEPVCGLGVGEAVHACLGYLTGNLVEDLARERD